jgi:hypothetical protein
MKEDLCKCIQKGFDEISEEKRYNLVFANYADLIETLGQKEENELSGSAAL